MTYPQQYPPVQQQVFQPKNGLGVASLVLGIIGLVFSPIPLIGVIAWPMVILGLIFGIVGFQRAQKGVATNRGVAIAGGILSAIGLAICIIWLAAFGATASNTTPPSDQQPVSIPTVGAEAGQPAVPPADPGGSGAEVVNLGFGEAYSWPGGEEITVSAPVPFTDYDQYLGPQEGRYIAMEVTIANNGDQVYQGGSADFTVQHNGRPAQEEMMYSDWLPDVQIPPGGNTTITLVYDIGAEPGEIQVSVQPNVFASTTVFYAGQV